MASTDYGAVLLQMEEFAEAERVLGEALGTFVRLGDTEGEGVALNNLAAAKEAVGDTLAALELVNRALGAMPDVASGHRAEVLQHATRLALQLQSTAHKAVGYADERLYLRKRELEAVDLVWEIASSAELLAAHGQLDNALRLFDDALSISDSIGAPELRFRDCAVRWGAGC